MDIQLRRIAFGVGESDFVPFLHQGANRNRQFVEIVASAGINLAIFQWQAMAARDQHQDFSFCCHFILLSEIESASRNPSSHSATQFAHASPSATSSLHPPASVTPRRITEIFPALSANRT